MARPGSVEKLREDELLLQVNTNFVGTVLCCQAAIPLLRGEDNPRIINISSASAWHADEMLHLSIYASTKAAVERFTRDLRNEVKHDGIGVTCVRPGAAWTNFSDGWDAQLLEEAFEAWRQVGTTMDSGMEVEQVAEALVHCLSYPAGVAVDLLEVRPNIPIPK
jgi:NAD(P)-dependent dehydrogenase (short-subunit alcohol dehydrogenase family)